MQQFLHIKIVTRESVANERRPFLQILAANKIHVNRFVQLQAVLEMHPNEHKSRDNGGNRIYCVRIFRRVLFYFNLS